MGLTPPTIGRHIDSLESALGLKLFTHRIGVSLEAMAISNPGMARETYQTHLRELADHLAAVLQCDDLNAPAARRLALEVMGLAHGIGTLLMAGQLSVASAQTLIKDYLERLGPRLSR